MDEPVSWLTRPTFSRTVCYRLDGITFPADRPRLVPDLKSSSSALSSSASSTGRFNDKLQQQGEMVPVDDDDDYEDVDLNSKGPLQEARSDTEGFHLDHRSLSSSNSGPLEEGAKSDGNGKKEHTGLLGKLFHSGSHKHRDTTSPLSSKPEKVKNNNKKKSKTTPWSRYFHCAGGKVAAVDRTDPQQPRHQGVSRASWTQPDC